MNVITYLSKRLLGEEAPKANENELTLQYWEIYITEGIRAAIYKDFHKITEIYVPELKLTINQAISPINIFLCDYDRYDSKNDNMSGHKPKLLKTVIISKKSEAAKNLIWLNEIYTKKKEREATLVKLFDPEVV
jgi:hypothetical protein